MRRRNNWLFTIVVAATMSLTLTSCSAVSGLFGGNSQRVANPNAEQGEKWDPLEALLPKTDVPSGWSVGGLNRAVEEESVDDPDSPGICGLTLDAPFQADMTAGATVNLKRLDQDQEIILGAAQAPNAEQTMSSVRKQLANCPASTDFKNGDISVTVTLADFSGSVDAQGGKTACRSYTMRVNTTANYGDFCVMARKDFLSFAVSSGPTEEQRVPIADFVQIADLQAKHLFK